MSTATAVRRTSTQPHCPRGHFMTAGSDTCKCGRRPAPPLAHRRGRTPVPIPEAAAGRAAMTARVVGLANIVPVLAWRGHADGTATATLPDGTHIRYQPHQRIPFAAAVPCLLGSHHYQSIRGLADLNLARVDAAACLTFHADFADWAGVTARDLTAAFATRRAPSTPAVLPLSVLTEKRSQF